MVASDERRDRAKFNPISQRTRALDIELEPKLQAEDFSLNQRYSSLVWQALEQEKISESKAAELLGMTIERLRLTRMEQEVYAVA
ncbi:hypothetical protein [Dactylococcopsis salina]|uniref:hypothetical protein n=1 Tax=Dactylococcopsis salina TaxID=292566 RepID=UPI0002F04E00|nr:hypothetical protein [Dactylococcopsis salina]